MLELITDIDSYVAPTGTVTVKLVAEAADTAALIAPKNTILFNAVVLKPVPVIDTVVPTTPLVGVNEVMVGGTGKAALVTVIV